MEEFMYNEFKKDKQKQNYNPLKAKRQDEKADYFVL